ncbi:alpha/beta fold hydrolase [Nitriliruptoraceae bacterium ZYF776]|nr:alpha/beta fold hydrolase [Profundirhabdus halotolerans]
MTLWTDLTGVEFAVRFVDVTPSGWPADADVVPTRALVAGDGPDVVFTHGTSGHLEAFSRNVAVHVAAGYRVHAIDMLGHGYTGKPDQPYEIADYVAHLVGYLDAQGIERAHLVGESLGGWVSAVTAAQHPDRVASLQLIAPGGTKANPEIMERIKTSTRRAVMEDDVSLTRDRLHLLMANPERDVSEELVQIRHAIYHTPEFQRNVDNLLSLQEMERRQRNLLRAEQMAEITAPTLIVWGRQNPFGEVPEAQLMHESIPGSQLELFDECGHWPQHERADLYNPLSLEFLAKSSG